MNKSEQTSYSDIKRTLEFFNIQLPSPVTKISSSLFPKKQHVYVKRDELSHPYLMGNKWRKLLPYLLELMKNKYDIVVSVGGVHSSHLLALAYACKKLSIKTHFLVRGEEPRETQPGNFYLLKRFAPQITYVPRSQFRPWETHTDKLFQYYLSKGMRSLVVPEGGSGVSDIGFRLFMDEFSGNIFDAIIMPMGTGSTFAHIYNLNQQSHIFGKVLGYPVVKMSQEAWIDELKKANYQGSIGNILWNANEKGFSKIAAETLAFSRAFIAETGIMIDPYYSGKALHYLSLEESKMEGNICFYHTGGIWGAQSRKNLFQTADI